MGYSLPDERSPHIGSFLHSVERKLLSVVAYRGKVYGSRLAVDTGWSEDRSAALLADLARRGILVCDDSEVCSRPIRWYAFSEEFRGVRGSLFIRPRYLSSVRKLEDDLMR